MLKAENKGSLLLEVLVAAGLGITIVVALTQIGIRALRDSSISQKRSQLIRFTEQGVEAVRSIRNQDIKGAFIDSRCNLPINDADPDSPHTGSGGDTPTCNEMTDMFKSQIYPTSGREFKLIPPGSGVGYWQITDQAVPEVLTNNISRKITIKEVSPTSDPNNIKKVNVRSWYVDGVNTYESVQETYLRRL